MSDETEISLLRNRECFFCQRRGIQWRIFLSLQFMLFLTSAHCHQIEARGCALAHLIYFCFAHQMMSQYSPIRRQWQCEHILPEIFAIRSPALSSAL